MVFICDVYQVIKFKSWFPLYTQSIETECYVCTACYTRPIAFKYIYNFNEPSTMHTCVTPYHILALCKKTHYLPGNHHASHF